MIKAMFLSAGLGTRMRPVTEHWPKPTVPFLNVPLFFWNVALLQTSSAGSPEGPVGPVVIDGWIANTHHRPEKLHPVIAAAGAGLSARFELSHEQLEPLGSGGGLKQAFDRGLLDGADLVLVVNADELTIPVRKNTIARFIEAHRRSGAIATLLTMDHPDAGGKFGAVWTDGTGTVHGFGRDGAHFPKAPFPKHYVGALLLQAAVLKTLPTGVSNLLYDTLQSEIRRGAKVGAFNEPLIWFETGNVADYLSATEEVLKLVSPIANGSDRAVAHQHAMRVLKQWHPEPLSLWESENGSKVLSSQFQPGSLSLEELTAVFRSESGFAVYGKNTLARAALFNAVSLPNSEVLKPVRQAINL